MADTTLLWNARIVDGSGAREGMAISIGGARIVRVEHIATDEVPPGAIDVVGKACFLD